MNESYSELIPAMDINEILLYFANPESLKKEVSSEELEKAKKELKEKFDNGFKAAQSLRDTIANYKCNIEYFKPKKIETQLDHLRELLIARPNNMVNQQKKDYKEYWDEPKDKKHSPLIPYEKLDDESRKRVDISLLTDAYHQYFDKGIRHKKGKYIPDFENKLGKQKKSKNEFLVHKNTNSEKAFFYILFIRQKDNERILNKIYKNIMIEQTIAYLQKREFKQEKCFIYDYDGCRVVSPYFSDKREMLNPLFFPPGPSIGYWQHDGKEHAKSRLDCVKYYLINQKLFPFSTVALQYTDLTSLISDEFKLEIKNIKEPCEESKSHGRHEAEWYKIKNEKKIESLKKENVNINKLEESIKKKEKYFNQINERLNIILP